MGGGVMRTAAKVAGIGVVNGSLRGVPATPVGEQSVRNASRPVSAVLSSSLKATAGAEVVAVQRPVWEIDEWEFAGVEDELVIGRGDPLPRVVFGAVPSFDEAKEATEELKEALDNRECLTDEPALLRVYLSSPGISYPESSLGAAQSVCSIPDSETKSCVNVETRLTTSLPEHALQAFKLLKESPQVQTVVTSIVTDQRVWSAMLDNQELKDFMQSCETETESQFQEQTENFEDASDASQSEKKSGNGFMNGLKNFKYKVTNMVSNLSRYVQNIFGISSAEIKSSDEKESSTEVNIGKSIMGLAVLVVMVVVLKRVVVL